MRCVLSSPKSRLSSDAPAPGREELVKVYISVDMEGIGGISHSKPT